MSGLHVCGSSTAVELPDAGRGPCCMGAAVYGPQRCTCWEPQYDQVQQPPRPGEPTVRATACADCAYRPDSPERNGAAGYSGDAEMLDDLPLTGQPFYCHQGIRRPARLRHPSGMEVQGHPADYEPPILDGVPYRADGTPAEVCAGWAARSAKSRVG